MWNFGLVQTLMNWASKSVAMAFALSAVEGIKLKRQAALANWPPGNSLNTVSCGLKLFLPEMAYESCRCSSSFASSYSSND